MAAIITSNVDTNEQLSEQFKDWGSDVVVQGTDSKEAETPAEEAKPSETTGEPGDKSAAEPEVKTVTDPETVETQEVPEGETDEQKKAKAKGGWQRRVEKLTLALEEEGEDKARVKSELRQLKTKLAELEAPTEKPAEEAPKDTGPARPKRPSMPDPSDFEYDPEKFSTARKKYEVEMGVYDDAMTAFFDAMAEKKVETRVQADRQQMFVEQQKVALANKVKAGAADYDDYDETLATFQAMEPEAPTDKCQAVNHFIANEAEHPAALYRYLMKDFLENDGAEGKRIAAMNDFRQVAELTKIEIRLASERATKKPAEKKPDAPKEAPAPPKPVMRKVPDAPIQTVGGHGTGSVAGNLEQQYKAAADSGNGKEAFRLLKLLETQSREAKQRR